MGFYDEHVSAFISAPVQVIGSDASLAQAQDRLLELGMSSLAVVEGRELVGVLSYTDLLRVGRLEESSAPYETTMVLPDETVESIMSRDLVSADVTTPLSSAAATMSARGLHRIYVLSGGQVVGVLSTRELMLAVRDAGSDAPVSALMSSPVHTIQRNAPVDDADSALEGYQISGVVVVDVSGSPIGMYSQREALRAAHHDRRRVVESVMSRAILTVPSTTAIHRAAADAADAGVRRICAVDDGALVGLVSGLDFARFVAQAA